MEGRRQWQLTPVLLPGEPHGWRSLVGCTPWGREESDPNERLHFHFSRSCIGEGNGNPLQCSCLENPVDGGAWWLPSMGLHRVGHDWSGLAVAKLCLSYKTKWEIGGCHQFFSGLSPKERGFRDFHMSQLYWAWFAPSIASLYLQVTLHSQMSTVLQGNNDLGQIGNFRKIPKMRIVNAIANPPLLAFPGLPRRLRW